MSLQKLITLSLRKSYQLLLDALDILPSKEIYPFTYISTPLDLTNGDIRYCIIGLIAVYTGHNPDIQTYKLIRTIGQNRAFRAAEVTAMDMGDRLFISRRKFSQAERRTVYKKIRRFVTCQLQSIAYENSL